MSLTVKRALARVLEQMLETQSVSRITVSALVDGAGLSRQTFYNNFVDVFDLINWSHAEHIRHASEAFWEHEDFCRAFESAIVSLRAHRAFYRNVARKDRGQFFWETFVQQQVTLCKRQIRQVTGREADRNTEYLLQLYWRGTASMLTDWVTGGMNEEPALLARLFYQGLPVPLQQYWSKNQGTKP